MKNVTLVAVFLLSAQFVFASQQGQILNTKSIKNHESIIVFYGQGEEGQVQEIVLSKIAFNGVAVGECVIMPHWSKPESILVLKMDQIQEVIPTGQLQSVFELDILKKQN